ncbi:hypothetical protein AUJ67_00100 [Candidatus Desantisbacteria bacterium CG1_02_49_89]|nr:MAG: hypothetical protein AUJ67_00100 [Candidatus Desantisbacteria bacterium CG1_02_49_89]
MGNGTNVGKGFTPRAFIIGIICVLFLSIATPYCDLVLRSTWIGSTFLPIGAISIFVGLILVLNTILKAMKLGLNTSELLLIYCMMIFGAGIPSFGLSVLLIPNMSAPFYLANATNKWNNFLQYVPKWLAPQDKDAIRYLYEGLPDGASMSMPALIRQIPWKPWIKPLFFWSILVAGIYLAMFSLVVILRKQWVENEKLVFPTATLPVEMVTVEQGTPSFLPSFFKNKIMWIFFAIPAVIYSLQGLHYYFPAIPQITLFLDLGQYLKDKPWNAMKYMWIRVYFVAVGFVFLLPLQLAFSLWFFYFFFQLQSVTGSLMGFPMPEMAGYPCRAFAGYQMAGATLTFAVLSFWGMRGHLKDIFAKVFKNDPKVDDSNEPASYKFAVFGLIAGILLIAVWGMMAGVNFWLMLLVAVIYFLILVSMTRLVSEGGMYYVQQQFRPLELIIPFTGSAAIAPASITMIALFEQAFVRDIRATLMPFLMDGYKISDSMNVKKRQVTIAMVCSVVIAVVVSYAAVLAFMYKYGGVNLDNWFTQGYPGGVTSSRIADLLNRPRKPSIRDIISMIAGGGGMIFLLWMRRLFLWWPFHPLGYIMGISWPVLQLWFSIFIAWLAKVIVLKIGGIKVYRMLVPGFLGLILGEFVTIGVWALVDFFLGVKGHQILFI